MSEIKYSWKVIENNDKFLELEEKCNIHDAVHKIMLEKAKMLDDFVYQNLETEILQGMKLKIENELLYRKLKGE